MSTYATQRDVESYIEGWVTSDPYGLERLIQRCEQDIDLLTIRTRWENPPTQVINIGASGQAASGGQYALGFEGVDTVTLTPASTAGQIEAALATLAAIGVDTNGVPNVTVIGTNPYTVIWNTGWASSNFAGHSTPSIVNGNEAYPVDYQVPLLTLDNSTLGVPATVVEIPGRKINPLTDIDRNQQLALSRATCAQVEYRLSMGEKFFVRPQFESVRGPDFFTVGKLPIIAPKAKRELSQVGLIHVSGRAYAGVGRRGVGRGWPTY